MIAIRADANKEIGTGHIMRCLSIAAALQEAGQEVCFILADTEALALLESKGQQVYVLHSDYAQLEEELPKLCELLESLSPDYLLIDSYYVTPEYLRKLGKYTKTAYVDDKNSFPYPVDMVINYNIYGDLLPYREQAAEEGMLFLLGTDYVPLREEFKNLHYRVKDKAEAILITTGGSDKYNLAGKILEKVLSEASLKELQYHVVSGMFNQNLPMLESLAEQYTNVHIHKNVTKMSELMLRADIAITAGGSTMYELSAVGVPIICFSFVDNQEQIVETFVKKDMVCMGGNYLTQQDTLMQDIAECLRDLIADKDGRTAYSEKGRRLVDGYGAERIARQLIMSV